MYGLACALVEVKLRTILRTIHNVLPVEYKFLAFFLSDYRESGSKTDLPVVPFPDVSKVELGGE